MKTPLIFATNNQNKVREIQSAIGDRIQVISLKDAGIVKEIEEPHETLEENAAEKSKVIYALTGKDCFGEDTGLEVEALNGRPGVKSARYSGTACRPEDNIAKLLSELDQETNRRARFRTIISLIWKGEPYFFEGICTGRISGKPSGISGFGYDPVFIPDGASTSFAEMTMEEKNIYSHRKKAAAELVLFLQKRITDL